MKNITTFLIALVAVLFLSGCKENKKQESELEPIISTTKIEWTAYKTTDKVPVKGRFNTIQLENIGQGNTIDSIMNGASFTVNAMDLATDDPARDQTITQSFFGQMQEAGSITGEFVIENDNWFLDLKMNGISVEKVPAKVTIEDNVLNLSTSIDLADFKALNALEVLNKVCHPLHMGADGISKTWETVDVVATLNFKDNTSDD